MPIDYTNTDWFYVLLQNVPAADQQKENPLFHGWDKIKCI